MRCTSLLLVPVVIAAFAEPLIAQVNKATTLVNPFIGTGGHGHTFPGACVPNGLVQLSPDTRPDGLMDWDGCGGYHYSDSLIYGFSHTHLSGTGIADLCDVLLMPVRLTNNTYPLAPTAYRSRFSHASESAHAGYYRVHLDDPDVDVELTSTAHVGVHRYTFRKGLGRVAVIVDLLHRDKLLNGSLTAVSDSEIVGERRSTSWAKDEHLFFCIRMSKDLRQGQHGWMTMGWSIKNEWPTRDPVVGAFTFNDRSDSPLIIKVGISAVSIEGARANLDAEVPGWDFDAVRKQAEDAWNAKLNKIEVTGGTNEQQRIFYTALYHCYVAPYIFNDVDGNYRGMDGQVHHADHNVYTVFSLWDTFRALHPLMTILEPDMTSDFIKTFLLHYTDGGRLPVWELWGNETDCMIGYHSVSVIADAYLKGIRGFDAELALKAMVASATRDEPGLNAFRAKGYISSEDAPESVSKTLEYAYDDGCIARMAYALGHDSLGQIFNGRSENWRSLYDPASGFFRARYNGGFKQPFDPYEVNFNFTEANAWQYSLFAPQALDQLVGEHGGNAAFEEHLDKLFSAHEATSGRDQADITGLIGQYAQGNEPSHNLAYLYDRIGRPEKTRALVKRVMDEFYHDAPDGLIGNEDCGQMSAWFVMSALGLYEVAPGIDPSYNMGYPLFDKATIHLANGKTWTMMVDPKATVSSTRECRIAHASLLYGGQLVLNAERKPVVSELSSSVFDSPYIRSRSGAPIIQAASAAFDKALQVKVIGKGACTVTDDAGTRSCPVDEPFTLEKTSTVQVVWSDHLDPVVAHFTKIDGDLTIKLQSTYSNQYAAGGDQALVDGQRGGAEFRTGEWQGYEGQDVLATIDLGAVKSLKRVGLSVLQDEGAWIWYPSQVQYAWSANGRTWSSATVLNEVPRTASGGQTQVLWTAQLNKHARYIKVIAKNAGPCPDWHPGKGGKTWIFSDEVLIEAE